MDVRLKTLIAAVLSAASALVAHKALAVDPAAIQAGPVYIAPTLDVETRYVDNLFRSADDEKRTWVLDTLPKVQAWLQNGRNTYSLAYQLQDFRYGSSHDDDYTDHQVSLDIHHEFNARNTLNLFGEYYDGHEERGTGLSEGGIAELIDEPVEVENLRYGGDYTYGSRESKGRLQAGYRFGDYDYQNFKRATQYRNRDADTLNGVFFWKVAPKTDFLAEVRYTDTEYDKESPLDPAGSLDSEEYSYFVGATWEATAKTSGSVRLGMFDRSYDSRAREDDDGFSWEVDVDYKPRTYSVINLGTRRYSRETNGLGDAINTEEYSITWDHDWNSRTNTHLKALLADDDYTGSFRSDDRIEVEAKYTYSLDRWFDIGGGYRYEERDSRQDNLDYDLNVYFIEAMLSL